MEKGIERRPPERRSADAGKIRREERTVMRGNGFDRSFLEAYEALFSVIFRVAYRITGDTGKAEDICHDAFIKYYERGRPFPDLTQAKYWLLRVVKNLSLNTAKRKKRERRAYESLQKIMPPAAGSEEDTFLKRDTELAVQAALKKLPHNLRIVLILKEYEGLTYKEIGSIMGISEGNVKVRVFRGREKLEKLFKRAQGEVS
jgi:RNA polymerase sigma-70 factor (ECF subfamily)